MKPRNAKLTVLVTVVLLATAQSIALAGDVDVRGATSTYILDVQNTSTQLYDKVAVYGKSAPGPWYGYGGRFEGGYTGVWGIANMSGTNSRLGVRGTGAGGSTSNFGLYGIASGGTLAVGVYGTAYSATTNYAGYFDGDIYLSGSINPSDETLKDDIVDLDGSLEQVMELKPKSFRFRTEDNPEMNLPDGYHMGLLAQDVEQVLPDLVKEVPVPEDPEAKGDNSSYNVQQPKTFLGTNYVELIPLLIRAIQEQQEQIATLQVEVAKLKGR